MRRALSRGWVRVENAEALGARLGEAMRIAEADGRARHRLAIAEIVLDVHTAAARAAVAELAHSDSPPTDRIR